MLTVIGYIIVLIVVSGIAIFIFFPDDSSNDTPKIESSIVSPGTKTEYQSEGFTPDQLDIPDDTSPEPPEEYYSPSEESDNSTCDCSLTCGEINTCSEAQYQLNTCGCYQRDADDDGIACDTMCQ